MFESKTVAVVVPCYNEQTQIAHVLDTMPEFVDLVIVVDDRSKDQTVEVVRAHPQAQGENPRVVLIVQEVNQGVGAAIVRGYKHAMERGIDVTAVMAGDGQMDPDELALLVEPVAKDQADYSKGNRLYYRDAWKKIPRTRFLGNSALSLMTKIASGYWHVADSQTGYTAISLEALELIDLDSLYPRYGYPNDMLVWLNVCSLRVAEVVIRPVYNVGEQSKLRVMKVMPRIAWLIFRRFWWRMFEKYVIRDFHPLVLFYIIGLLCFLSGSALGVTLILIRLLQSTVAGTSAVFAAMLFSSGLQLLLFAMWFDMEVNRPLRCDVHRHRLHRDRRKTELPERAVATTVAEHSPAGARTDLAPVAAAANVQSQQPSA